MDAFRELSRQVKRASLIEIQRPVVNVQLMSKEQSRCLDTHTVSFHKDITFLLQLSHFKGILRISVGSDGGENGKQTEKIWGEITGLELFTWIE